MDMIAAGVGAIAGIGAVSALTFTREYRTLPAGVADLINWVFVVDPGIILQKDGSLLTGWNYRGPDLTAATDDDLGALSRYINDAILPLNDQWMIHVDAVRRPAPVYEASPFPNAVTALIDAERRAAYAATGEVTHPAHFETEYVLTATYLPPPELYGRAARLFVTGGGEDESSTPSWDERLKSFRLACSALEMRLASRLRMQRLSSEALVTHLHRCLTGRGHPVIPPPDGVYLDSVLADQELVGGFEPIMGGEHIRVVAVEGYPSMSTPGVLDALNRLPFAYRWSNRLLPLGHQTAAKLIRRHQLNWFKKRKGAGTWLREMAAKGKEPSATRSADEALFHDQNAQTMAEDAATALAENASGGVRFCVFNQCIVVMEPTSARADMVASEILKTLHDHGFPARIETVNALDALLGTLPGHGAPNVRRPLLNSANIADCLPVTSVWPGLAHNPSPYFPPKSPPLLWAKTDGSTPFRINLHVSDVGHTMILGPTGAGKSTLVGLIAAQFQRYPNAQLFVCDVGYSGWLLAQAAGATHYDIAAPERDVQQETIAFQPLAQIDSVSERTWATEWLELLLDFQGVTVTAAHRGRLAHAMSLLAHTDVQHRTLTELCVQLQDLELVAALRPYTAGGSYGRLLDADRDGLSLNSQKSDARYQVFELRHLFDMDDKILVPVLLYLFHRIEQRLDGSPTLIVIEELWAPLMRSVFANRIKQWLLTLRKQNAAVLLVAHSPAQLAAVPNGQIIAESCPTRIFLPNAGAAGSQAAVGYRDLGLNDREIATIAGAVPKRDYYLTSPHGSRLFELGVGPATLAFLASPNGMTADEVRAEVGGLMTQYGAEWPSVWLRRCGLPEWGERWNTLIQEIQR